MNNFDIYDTWNIGAGLTAIGVGIKVTAPFIKRGWMKITGNRYATIKDVRESVDELETKVVETMDKNNKVFATAILDIKDMVKGLCEKNGVEVPKHEKPEPEVQAEAAEDEA